MQGLASSLGAWARGYPNFRAEGISTEPPLLPSSAGRACRCRPCAPDPQLIPLSLARAVWGSPRSSRPSLTPLLPLPFLQNMPNVRDHDASVYLRLQGDALSVGGYESNPIFWEEVSGAGRFFQGGNEAGFQGTHFGGVGAGVSASAPGSCGYNLRMGGGESTGQHLPFGSLCGIDRRCRGNSNGMKRLGCGD